MGQVGHDVGIARRQHVSAFVVQDRSPDVSFLRIGVAEIVQERRRPTVLARKRLVGNRRIGVAAFGKETVGLVEGCVAGVGTRNAGQGKRDDCSQQGNAYAQPTTLG